MLAKQIWAVILHISLSFAFIPSPITGTFKGFNYGPSVNFASEFATAKTLVGTSGFASARLYTMIQPNTVDAPTAALQAAKTTTTTLLLGLYCSAGNASFQHEINALKNAIIQYPDVFKTLVIGVSVGSEDIYRSSVFGTPGNYLPGDTVPNLTSYISQTRSTLDTAGFKNIPIGHVDTWQMWANRTGAYQLLDLVDFVGMDGYTYWQNLSSSSVTGFSEAYATVNSLATAHGNKPVYVTETGWPNSGATRGAAVASAKDAYTYWQGVGCGLLFDKINTWWYTLNDAPATASTPSFGILSDPTKPQPMFSLSCTSSTATASSKLAATSHPSKAT